MGMFSSKTKNQKDPDKFFDRERLKEFKRAEKQRQKLNPVNKRKGLKEAPILPGSTAPPAVPPGPGITPPPPPAHVRAYDTEALDCMRRQLHNDSDAFLLNNILLSVQFFENYEREVRDIRNNPISEREHLINEAMVRHHKHVFFADRLQECVHEHVRRQPERGQVEPLSPPRLFVIYDNVEASEPGDMSDYSAVLDAPFYKLCVEDCGEPGYIQLKKLEVLESTQSKDRYVVKSRQSLSGDSVYTDSEKESIASDDFPYYGKEVSQNINTKETKSSNVNGYTNKGNLKINMNTVETSGRRRSGTTKHLSTQAERSKISNMNIFQKRTLPLPEESVMKHRNGTENKNSFEDNEVKPRKSILKNMRRSTGPVKEVRARQSSDISKAVSHNTIAEDTETSGYRSTNSSRQYESSENESDYAYSSIKESTTPKKLELSEQSKFAMSSGVLPEECWRTVQVRAIDHWGNDTDELGETAPKIAISRHLYETYSYLGSSNFMNNFLENFIVNLGSGLGLTQEAVKNALTQGASIYCDTTKNGLKMNCEVFPAVYASWPNAAYEWSIRERKIIQNPRTNFSYQWPRKYMINKALASGCLLLPIGFRPKRGLNPDEMLQWRISFPAAERYLESCLAHSHMRCYLFALVLIRTFVENNTYKIGIDASHIKNHLFWQCEDNYARWPEDRLGETLRFFLSTFYVYFAHEKLPNYFIESSNDFKGIPRPLLRNSQRRLADILERPVMHILSALNKIKYTKKHYYPPLKCYKLYEILTCKNPLRILNPNLPVAPKNYTDSSDESEDDTTHQNFWDSVKTSDKNYQWQKEKHRQLQQRRKAQVNINKQKAAARREKQIDTSITLPTKMEAERRRPVLEFFIDHFIAMAVYSDLFEAVRQAVIYLEQAQRLCILLQEEPHGNDTAKEYLFVIREKLADCQRKLANEGGLNLPRRDSKMERHAQRPMRRMRPPFDHIVNQDSPTETHNAGAGSAFTFVDVHAENSKQSNVQLEDAIIEESKL